MATGSKILIEEIAALGKQFSDKTIALHEAIARNAGLTGTEHKYLNILLDAQQMTAGEFSKASGLTTGAVTGVIDRLEKQGFVKREFVKNDRRKVIIVADVVAINKVLGQSSKLLLNRILGFVKNFTAAEHTVIERYLNETIKVMDNVITELR